LFSWSSHRSVHDAKFRILLAAEWITVHFRLGQPAETAIYQEDGKQGAIWKQRELLF
jgi:hypothetical protein